MKPDFSFKLLSLVVLAGLVLAFVNPADHLPGFRHRPAPAPAPAAAAAALARR